MPKASSNPEHATQGGGGIEPGAYEVVSACYRNNKTDFKDTHLALVLGLVPVEEKTGKKVSGADTHELFLSYGSKSYPDFRPGKGKDRDDENPKDMGDEVDAEGNTIYTDGSGQFNKSVAAMVFFESLASQGFPKAALNNSWAPDFVGMKFVLRSATAKECNDLYNLRLNTRPMTNREGKEQDITYRVASKWLNPSYLKSGGTETSNSEEKATKPTSTESVDVDELTKELLAELGKTRGGEDNAFKNTSALNGAFTALFTKKKKPAKLLGQCQAKVKNNTWLEETLGEMGGYIRDDGAVVLPENTEE